jgi:hypothetical protein
LRKTNGYGNTFTHITGKKKEVHTVMTEKFTNNKKYSTDFVQLAVLKKERTYPH